jgi:hypothetical protein
MSAQHNDVARARTVQPQVAGESSKPAALRGEDFAEMTPRLDLAATIKGLIARQSFVGIIAPSGAGKTFFATDMACCVSLNEPWRNRKVIGGLCVYGALEGAGSARNRFFAWRQRYLRDRPHALPLRAMLDSINLRDPMDVLRMIDFIKAAESDHEAHISLCFIDTLSRAMSGGNENSPDDMGALIRGADAIRLATGATVVLIHHLGKDEGRGARGHNSLFAAFDTEITIRLNGDQHIASVTKQRDFPGGDEFAFTLESVEIGRDSDGDPITSCVVVPSDSAPDTRKRPSGKNQLKLLAALQEWHREHLDDSIISSIDLVKIGKAQGIPRTRLPEAREGLEKAGWLQPCTGGCKFVPEVSK